MSEMFCFQCQQTAGNSGCVRTGVCGKQPKTANLQDYLVCSLIHLAEIYAAKEDYPPEVTHLLADGLFATLTNVNFDDTALQGYIRRAEKLTPSVSRYRTRVGYGAAIRTSCLCAPHCCSA